MIVTQIKKLNEKQCHQIWIVKYISMPLLSLFTILVCLSGCNDNHCSAQDEAYTYTQWRYALFQALYFAYEALEEQESITNVQQLRDEIFNNKRVVIFDKYGENNVFFNPDFSLWNPDNMFANNDSPDKGSDTAIVIKLKTGYYYGICFNGLYNEKMKKTLPFRTNEVNPFASGGTNSEPISQ
ncbi:MAG: hypothetical protein EOM44_14895 [Bacteroidia bacterium]|nr:hypothetical protein [Bacteroidia bacterium]NCC60612.1 hypothetical protein [Verrucomicrobiae bacterium]